jgi:hypothetical protein
LLESAADATADFSTSLEAAVAEVFSAEEDT